LTVSSGAGAQRRNIYAGVGLAFGLLVAAYFFSQVREVVLTLLLVLLFSIIISGPVDFLVRKGLGRGWATLIVMGSLALVLALVISVFAPIVTNQAQQLAQDLPMLLSDAQARIEGLLGAFGLSIGSGLDPQQLLDSARGFLSGGTASMFLSVGASVANVLSLGLVILVSTIFTVASPAPLVNGFVALFPAGRRERTRGVLSKMYSAVQGWFLGQLVDMVLVGFLSTIALFVIGVPFALLLGILTGLLCFVPFLGPVLSVIPPVLLALASDPVSALWVILAYLTIQVLESNLIQPVVMSRAVSLHPVAIVFSILIMGNLFQAVGVLLAVPLAAALYVLVRELWVKRMDERGTDSNPPAEEKSSMEKGVGRLKRALEAPFRRS
jgi:predicted PurR-regulated permease PerM